MQLSTIIGSAAAFCTTISYVPQIMKCRDTSSARDLSLRTYLILSCGIAMWVVYGVFQSDAVLITANSISLAFLVIILYFRITRV
jgi:MtN3 and saliva related transmembrane protein